MENLGVLQILTSLLKWQLIFFAGQKNSFFFKKIRVRLTVAGGMVASESRHPQVLKK